ncbi:hypothetical protein P1J78_06350 [Psychromarinibacter sp. C21-152]|uniref:Peptidase MA superfamily protein n=1 Tax=Psychromarinibacter sediminicola TaxID=3033385 RepID=A0AAE3NN26_9RHOB|nr:hypothetical protein [Psychromarinibacter sediminicola]MDF0600343.1 hypothetical protein [Psychromarinibacter sediminicola]
MVAFRMIGAILRAVTMAALVGGALAFAAVPSPYRAFTPESYGLTEISPTLYIDAPEAADRVAALIARAEANTRAFFGPLETDPVWVVCTAAACADRLGMRANGLTYGFHLIVVGPGGVNETILTHERVHAELHRHLDVSDILSPRFPAWFDEGLAAYLSGDPRLRQPADPRDADWIRAADDWLGWNDLRDSADWRDRYGAAARLVAEIEERAGRDGLRALVARVGEDGADFETEWHRLTGR